MNFLDADRQLGLQKGKITERKEDVSDDGTRGQYSMHEIQNVPWKNWKNKMVLSLLEATFTSDHWSPPGPASVQHIQSNLQKGKKKWPHEDLNPNLPLYFTAGSSELHGGIPWRETTFPAYAGSVVAF